MNSDIQPERTFAIEELGKCGPAAVRTINGMLDDPVFADECPDLIKALADAGGNVVGPELHRRLQQELAFSKSAAPALSPDWWNQDTSVPAPLSQRYSETYQLVMALEQSNYLPLLSTVVELRDLWQSSPSMSENKQLIEKCDELTAHARGN